MNDIDYLDPSFDYHACTKPQLRSILASAGVTSLPPATSKKEELIKLFEREIVAKRAQLRIKRGKVKPSDKGIITLDDESKPTPRKTPEVRSRTTTISSPSTTPTRGRSPSKRSQADAVRDKRPALKKTAKTPTKTRSRSPSKGSKSPEQGPMDTTPVVKRKTSFNLLESPLAALQRALPAYSDTPRSATMKLHNRLQHLGVGTLPPKSISSTTLVNARNIVLRLLKFLFVGFGLLSVVLWIRWKFLFPFPFCTTPKPSLNDQFALFKSNPTKFINEYCLDCPLHGTCRDGHLFCQDGFMPSPNIIYFGATCRPDHLKLKYVEDLSQKTSLVLSRLAGDVVCQRREPIPIPEADLAELLSERYPEAPWLSKWDEMWKLALREFRKEPRLAVDITTNSEGHIFLQSRSPRIGLFCRLKLWVGSQFQRYRAYIMAIAFCIASVVAISHGYKGTQAQRVYYYLASEKKNERVQELVRAVLQILAEQVKRHITTRIQF